MLPANMESHIKSSIISDLAPKLKKKISLLVTFNPYRALGLIPSGSLARGDKVTLDFTAQQSKFCLDLLDIGDDILYLFLLLIRFMFVF